MDRFRIPSNFRLAEVDQKLTHGMSEARSQEILEHNRKRIAELQNALYAEAKRSLLIVLQSMDTGGKDPIIRDVLSAANPQACRVTAFKKPSESEAKRDRFWRFHEAVPAKGEMGVFNRSYFDEVIHNAAHEEIDDEARHRYYGQTRKFEQLLVESEITIIKIYLHISNEEQRKRLQERMAEPTRHWELSEADFKERKFWDGYMRAYEDMIRHTDDDASPWYLIPADHKWYRDAAASIIISGALERMNPQFPPSEVDLSKVELV